MHDRSADAAGGGPFDPVTSSEVVARYVRETLRAPEGLVSIVDLRDEMFLYNLRLQRNSEVGAALLYFLKGSQIAAAVSTVARHFFGAGGVGSLLDFASGFGRATRFLVHETPPERVWVSDIQDDAAAFQRRVLGVHDVASARRPEAFAPGRRFDLIAASSFFSHLPAHRFEEWLRSLFSCLEEDGVLIFSAHGDGQAPDPGTGPPPGAVYYAESESARLDSSEYGTSYVTAGFVRAAVGRSCGPAAKVLAIPFGLCADQDLYVVTARGRPAASDLRVPIYPRGKTTRFAISCDGAASLDGWAQGMPDAAPPSVALVFGTSVHARVSPTAERGATVRWTFSFDTARVHPDEVVRVEARDENGHTNILEMGTLRPHLPAATAAR